MCKYCVYIDNKCNICNKYTQNVHIHHVFNFEAIANRELIGIKETYEKSIVNLIFHVLKKCRK